MSRPRSLRVAAIGAALVAVTMTAFSGALTNAFLNYDDDVYVTENPHVVRGLSGENLVWAFRTTDAANWHPVTWLSHMSDVEAFGLDAGRHHLTSLLLHATNVLVLFLLLLRMTGALWRSAFVAALFAIHPLHVESVAWIAERKDVLSTLFWLLTTAAWLHWLDAKTAARYALVVVLFALGLMAKPMLVTLPLTLMLLDVWPLKRATLPLLWSEKAPLLAMSLASSIVTFTAQHRGGTVPSLAALGFAARVAHAAEAYVSYLGKTFWPTSLACLYPYPATARAWPAFGSALLLAAVTALALRLARRAPHVVVGWTWYLVTLVPVIGLVQVGVQAAADRYTYVPLIGVFVAIAWGLGAVAEARPRLRYAVAALSAASLVALFPLTRAQVRTWHDNDTLFAHALAVTSDNSVAHNNLGLAKVGGGKLNEGITHYREALRINPQYVDAMNNLAAALHHLGRDPEAIDLLQRALAIDPKAPSAHVNFGNALVATGQVDAAIEHYALALRVRPEFYDAHQNLGLVLERLGRHDEAIPHLARALLWRPSDPAAHLGLGIALSGAGRFDEALRQYDMALRLKPDYAEAMNNAGLALAAINRLPEAIERFEQAVRINPGFAQAHNNLGVSLARVDRIPEAIEQFEQAVRLDPGLDQARMNLANLRNSRR